MTESERLCIKRQELAIQELVNYEKYLSEDIKIKVMLRKNTMITLVHEQKCLNTLKESLTN